MRAPIYQARCTTALNLWCNVAKMCCLCIINYFMLINSVDKEWVLCGGFLVFELVTFKYRKRTE